MTALGVAQLIRKYRLVAELRDGVGVLSAAEAREPLRALSREFPGALREVDVLSAEAISSRRAELEVAVEPYAVWMRVVHAYHQTMAVSLWLKAALGKSRQAPQLAELAAEASRRHGVVCDVTWVAAVASPPGGRLNRLVFEELSAEFGLPVAELRALLFPGANHGSCSPGEVAI